MPIQTLNTRSSQEIILEFSFLKRQLKSRFQYYSKLIRKGHKIPSALPHLNYTKNNDIQLKYQLLEQELQRKYGFELTASFEADLVYYFRKIVKKSSVFGKLLYQNVTNKKLRGQKYLMLHDLDKLFKLWVHPKNSETHRLFKHLVEYRNWLAHGRSWRLGPHFYIDDGIFKRDKFDIDEVSSTTNSLINLLPNYPV